MEDVKLQQSQQSQPISAKEFAGVISVLIILSTHAHDATQLLMGLEKLKLDKITSIL